MFVGRKAEFAELERRYAQESFQFLQKAKNLSLRFCKNISTTNGKRRSYI